MLCTVSRCTWAMELHGDAGAKLPLHRRTLVLAEGTPQHLIQQQLAAVARPRHVLADRGLWLESEVPAVWAGLTWQQAQLPPPQLLCITYLRLSLCTAAAVII